MNKDEAKVFKSVIEDIVNAQLAKYGITKYISAIVQSINSNGTVNVYIPPDETQTVSSLLNKTGEILNVGDSVEICTKNGKMNNAWIALKHGTNVTGTNALASYPVGSIYLSLNNTNPGQIFGGTWVQISGYYLYAGTSTGTGGSNISGATTLNQNQIPGHTHSIPSLSGTAAYAGEHTHGWTQNGSGGAVDGSFGRTGSIANNAYMGVSNSVQSYSNFQVTMAPAGGHTHSVTTNGSTTGSTGATQSHTHTIQPPYYSVYAFRRTA